MCIYYRDKLQCGCTDEGVIPCAVDAADLPEIDGVDWSDADRAALCEGVTRQAARLLLPPCARHAALLQQARPVVATTPAAVAASERAMGDATAVALTLGGRVLASLPLRDVVGMTVVQLVAHAVAAAAASAAEVLADDDDDHDDHDRDHAHAHDDDGANYPLTLLDESLSFLGLDFLPLGQCVERLLGGEDGLPVGELRLADLARGGAELASAKDGEGGQQLTDLARLTLRGISKRMWLEMTALAVNTAGEALLVPPLVSGPEDVTLSTLAALAMGDDRQDELMGWSMPGGYSDGASAYGSELDDDRMDCDTLYAYDDDATEYADDGDDYPYSDAEDNLYPECDSFYDNEYSDSYSDGGYYTDS
jgi:hypothetical protein